MKVSLKNGPMAFVWALALSFLLTSVAAGQAGSESKGSDLKAEFNADELIKQMQDQMWSATNYSEMTMTVYNPDWPAPRSYSMRGWEDVKNKKSFIRITAPARDRGKAFLKDGYVFKVYIPTERENKPITIPPSLMLQPWMGSDFTNDDLVRESSVIKDYTHELVGVEKGDDGKELVHVRLVPKPDAPVVWSKLDVWVDPTNYLPTRELYFDDSGNAVREMTLSDVKEMSGRPVPTHWEMKSLEEDKKGRRTVIEIEKMEFDIKIDPSIFTDKNLTRRDWE